MGQVGFWVKADQFNYRHKFLVYPFAIDVVVVWSVAVFSIELPAAAICETMSLNYKYYKKK